MDIITRLDAQRAGRKRFYTGKPCKHDHLAERFVSNGACVDCINWRTVPSAGRRNAFTPPSPMMFSAFGPPVSAEEGTYVWCRFLASGLADAWREEFTRLRPLANVVAGSDPSQEATTVFRYWQSHEGKRTLRALPKANGVPLETYQSKGWRPDQLVAEGFAEWVTAT